MKKVLSVILTMAMLLSMFSCLFTTGAAAETSNSVVIQDFETGFTQSTTSVLRDPDNIEETDKPIWSCTVKNDDTTYLNIGGIDGGKSIHYLTNIAETGMLKTDGTKYNFTFKYRIHKGTATATNQAVKFTLQTQTASTSLGFVEKSHNADYETEWRTATIENITPVANDLYTKLRLEGGSGTAGMTVDIDDCVFTEVVTASATANGVGTAKVNNTKPVYGSVMTYTAKTANTFLGWFDGVNPDPVSTNEVYTFTYNGTQPVALTAKFEGKTVVQDFETGFMQSTTTSVLRDPDNIEENDKPIWSCTVKNDDTTYLNIGDIAGGKSIHYLTNIAETGMLSTDGTKYNLTFEYRIHKGTATATNQAVKFTLQTQTAGTSLGFVEKSYNADYETEWRTATIENITPVANDLYTKLRLEGGSGTKDAVKGMTVDIDDCVFTEVVPAVSTSVTVEGKLGTASVDKTEVKKGNTVTYTATEYLAGAFLGWYDGVNPNPVSTDGTYTFTYDGTQALDLTAKFRTDIIAQTFETGWAVKEGTSNQIPRDPDNKTSKNTYGTIETENGNKYLKITIGNDGTWLHYAINENETGLLDIEDTLYSVTFKYKVLTETDKEIRVFFWGQNDDGTTNQDWNTITFNGGTRATGVKLNYTAEAAGTWQTATINNVITDGYTTGRLAALVTNAPGVQFAIDDIVFTEYVPQEEPAVSTSVTVEGTTGTATVDKEEVKKGDTVTYTATENIAGAFLGWYNGETLVSADKVYTFTYTGAEALALTAKFAAAYNTSVAVEGKLGTATVDKAEIVKGNTVTYTATEYLAGAFLGWYDSKGEVSADKEYTFTYDGTQELALTAKFRTDIIAQTFETGFTQSTTTSVLRDPDNIEPTDKPIWGYVKNDDTTYLNIGGIADGKNIQYLTNIAETGMLDANKTYSLTFKYRIHKGTATATNQAVMFILQPQNANTSLGSVERWYDADYETEWRTATIENITPVANDLYTKLRLEGGSGNKGDVTGMTVDIDDCVFTEVIPTFDTSVTVDGKFGTATVDKAEVAEGEAVTYTATEYLAGAFAGWYNGEVLVSADKTYTFTYTGEEALALTAKFISESIAQTFETGWVVSSGTSSTIARNPDNKINKNTYGTIETENGNKYLKITIGENGSWLHYVINDKETGLLNTDASVRYNLTFKYKILTATEKTVNVFFWNQNDDGSTTADWESITSNGGVGATGVKLIYDAENANTWQTATIYNVKKDNYTTGRLAAHITNATGVQFAIDDVIFTETFIANASANGAGNAQVSKRYVEKGDTVTFTATANDNGEFVAWLDAEGNEVSTDATYTVTNFDGTQVINLTAKFKTLVSASATVDNPENGGATCVVEGDTVTFTATEVRENSFIGWFDAEGNFVDGNKSFNVVYNGTELAYTAKFKNADGTFDTEAFDKAFNAQYVKFNGTAMRAQDSDKPQALRFKTTIKARDLLAENGFVGMKVVEYGTLIGNTKKLAGAELTHATEGHLIGVAYNSAEDKDIVFDENNNGDIQFTAALTGIKAKNYGDRLTMRAYFIVSDGENTYTIYADEYEYSVYDVMYAITIKGNQTDKDIVNAILNADADVKTKFEEYVTVNFPAQA